MLLFTMPCKNTRYVFMFLICASIVVLLLTEWSVYINTMIRKDYMQGHNNLTTTEFVRHQKQQGEPVMYIFSAFGSKTMNYSGYATSIKLSGWMYTKHCLKPIKCCILWRDDAITTISSPIKLNSRKTPTGIKLFAPQIICPFHDSLQNVAGVTVEFTENECPRKEGGLYVRPSIPETTVVNESFAVCLKIVYGNVDNVKFIDWLEYNRAMKVDKVFMNTYNVTEATHDVIRHYVEMGFVESRYFDYPLKSEFPNLGVKSWPIWILHRPTMHDCLQRSAGYKYLSIFDMDEMLVPRRHGNIKELMTHLMELHPDAAGFTLPSCVFDTNQKPDPNAPVNATDARKYIRRSQPSFFSRNKNIILPSRTTAQGLTTHQFTPSKPYRRVHVNSSDATINHYRRCADIFKDSQCLDSRMVEDRYILHFMDQIKFENFETS